MNVRIRKEGRRIVLVINGTVIGKYYDIQNLINALSKVVL